MCSTQRARDAPNEEVTRSLVYDLENKAKGRACHLNRCYDAYMALGEHRSSAGDTAQLAEDSRSVTRGFATRNEEDETDILTDVS
jgi:hypothetical protein